MIADIAEAILDKLATVSGAKSVGPWTGAIDDLLQKPQNLPGLYLVYQGATIEGPITMGTTASDCTTSWQVVVVTASRKSQADGAAAAWSLIEAVRSELHGLEVGGYGALWCRSEELSFAENGVLVYGMTYSMETRI